ncbi:partial Teichoic acid translocation permease protein TagG, partial [Anaerolineales bacterium]
MTLEDNKNTEVQETIIRPGRLGGGMWKELWQYRELFFFLAWRDILVRYKQTVIGVAWCLLKPFVTMIIFSLVFGTIARLPSEGMPYPVFVFAALIPWQFFSSALTESSNSLVTNANLMSKVYFPRMIVPVSSVVVSLVDLIVSFTFFLVVMASYGHIPTVRFLFMPMFLVPALLAAVGGGLWFAALNV